MISSPFFSIITPCLNRAEFVSQAIESVLSQGFPNFEHIIVDGGSSDGTLEILSRYPHLHVISEKDNGMYQALNRGLSLAKGQVVGFLNTDDLYPPQTLQRVAAGFADLPESQAILGASVYFSETSPGQLKFYEQQPSFPASQIFEVLIHRSANFNAWFFRKKCFSIVGGFDESCRYNGDRDFILRFGLLNLPYLTIPDALYYYRRHAGSLTINDDILTPLKYFDEATRMYQIHINKRSSTQVREICRSCHTQYTINLVSWTLRHKKPLKALKYLLSGCIYDFLWPKAAIQRIYCAIKRRL